MALPRTTTRLRYGRVAAMGSGLVVTLVAVLGGMGLLPEGAGSDPVAQAVTLEAAEPTSGVAARGAVVESAAGNPAERSAGNPAERTAGNPAERTRASADGHRFTRQDRTRSPRAQQSLEVPPASGEDRRVVFDMGAQRVWLVEASGAVRRTYLVSGSLTDNLDAGSYSVYSKSEQAWGIDDSGTMRYMVRFAHGERAAIGFHDIPTKDGQLVQTRAELGAPQSHGCIRQARPDAQALWRFAPVGTPVVVVA